MMPADDQPRVFAGPAPEPKAEVRNLFPTPVVVSMLPEADTINALIKPVIHERARATASRCSTPAGTTFVSSARRRRTAA